VCVCVRACVVVLVVMVLEEEVVVEEEVVMPTHLDHLCDERLVTVIVHLDEHRRALFSGQREVEVEPTASNTLSSARTSHTRVVLAGLFECCCCFVSSVVSFGGGGGGGGGGGM
jgi:hypothetical protein